MEKNERNPSPVQRLARVLTIAGSDSGGCAGLQADLKTFAALQTHGLCAVTALTAQDTEKVHSAFEIPTEFVARQIEVVAEDIGINAVKTGMLSSAAIICCVTAQLQRYQIRRLVVDPVMISTGGDRLIQKDAIRVLVNELFPLATVVTPNMHEAEALVGRKLSTSQEIRSAAREICSLGPQSVVIKGGHLQDPEQSDDLFYDGNAFHDLKGKRIKTHNTHGSGCTFSAAIAAYLAKDLSTAESVFRAKQYVQKAIQNSFSLGKGNGPLGHFWKCWE